MLQPPPEEYHRSRLKMGGVAFLMAVFLLFVLVTVPALRGSLASAWRAQCLCNLKQLGLAIHMYSQDNNDRFPSAGLPRGQGGVASLEVLYADYVSDPNLFICPADEQVTPWDGKGKLSAAHCSYGYDHAHTSADPADVAIMADYTGVEKSHDGLPTCHYHPLATMWGHPVGNVIFVLFVDQRVIASHTRHVGHDPGGAAKRDDIYTESQTLPPGEDSWITQ